MRSESRVASGYSDYVRLGLSGVGAFEKCAEQPFDQLAIGLAGVAVALTPASNQHIADV